MCPSSPRSRQLRRRSTTGAALPIERAGPAHVATLKTIVPPLASLRGAGSGGGPTGEASTSSTPKDSELVLIVHLMSAGPLRYLLAGEEGPQDARVSGSASRRRRAHPYEAGWKARRRMADDAGTGDRSSRLPGSRGAGDRRRRLGGDPHGRLATSPPASAATSARSPGSDAPRQRDPQRTQLSRSRSRRSSRDAGDERPRRRNGPASSNAGIDLRVRGALDPNISRFHNRLGEPSSRCGTRSPRRLRASTRSSTARHCGTGGRY